MQTDDLLFVLYDIDHGIADSVRLAAADRIEVLEAWKAEAEQEIARQRRRATDAEYMSLAFRNMLGPKGQEVATMWDARGVTRVHFDWGPDASEMTGEQRAEFILSIENLPSTPLDFNDGKGPRTNRAARRLVEKEDGRG